MWRELRMGLNTCQECQTRVHTCALNQAQKTDDENCVAERIHLHLPLDHCCKFLHQCEKILLFARELYIRVCPRNFVEAS